MERTYIIPLRNPKRAPQKKRAKLAVREVRDFIAKHMKSEEVKIDKALNERIWAHGMKNIPSKIKVKATSRDDGSVLVTLAE
jgi:large subunit ribosomal protein L31e